MYERILIATDYSEQATDAIGHGLAIAHSSGAQLHLVHVLPALPLVPPYPVGTASLYEDQTREIAAAAKQQLARVVKNLPGEELDLTHELVIDMPAPGILATAESLGVDLIVLGTHGRKGVSQFLMGSVAQKVAQRAHCDVLVTRGPAPEGGYRGLLVPTDFSDGAKVALDRARDLAAADARIDLLHCWQLPGEAANYWGLATQSISAELDASARKLGEAMRSLPDARHCQVSYLQKEVEARVGIREEIEQGSYDLVVMGSRGRTGLARWLLGSVAQATIRHSTVSVYVARERSAT